MIVSLMYDKLLNLLINVIFVLQFEKNTLAQLTFVVVNCLYLFNFKYFLQESK